MSSTKDNKQASLDFVLELLNVSGLESQTFKALSEQPDGLPVSALSKHLGCPRTTIYGHIESLVAKGLVKKELGEHAAIFRVSDVTDIKVLYEEKIHQLQEAKKSISQVMKQGANASYKPRVVYYDNVQAPSLIFKEILRSRVPCTYWFWPIAEMLQVIPRETFLFFNQERIKRNIYAKVLWPAHRKVQLDDYPFLGSDDSTESLREIKQLPKKLDQTIGYVIFGNKVAFIASRREYFAYVIDSKEFSKTLQAQFEYFWEL